MYKSKCMFNLIKLHCSWDRLKKLTNYIPTKSVKSGAYCCITQICYHKNEFFPKKASFIMNNHNDMLQHDRYMKGYA